jgi:hypothetical protein
MLPAPRRREISPKALRENHNPGVTLFKLYGSSKVFRNRTSAMKPKGSPAVVQRSKRGKGANG